MAVEKQRPSAIVLAVIKMLCVQEPFCSLQMGTLATNFFASAKKMRLFAKAQKVRSVHGKAREGVEQITLAGFYIHSINKGVKRAPNPRGFADPGERVAVRLFCPICAAAQIVRPVELRSTVPQTAAQFAIQRNCGSAVLPDASHLKVPRWCSG
ncbi:MAG: hypothetical protein NTX79_04655 [Candidatus Micrarchaeota archaeon]|nr:hypothetical protein [Candidatus Micrarchaeota archaeon]